MDIRVTTIEFEAEVAGMQLAVEGAVITNRVNDIPTIELQCAPSDGGSSTALRPNVVTPSLSDFASLYNKLSEAADGMSQTGHVRIQTKGVKSESLELNNWVLVGVGLSSVSATNAPYMTVILQHPICKLTKVGSIYETVKAKGQVAIDMAIAGAGDPIQILEQVYSCMKGGGFVEYWPYSSSSAKSSKTPSSFRTRLGSGEFAPSKYLTFKSGGGGGIFLKSKLKGAASLMPIAIGRHVMPSAGCSSTWDVLVNMSGTLLLSITQDSSNNYLNDKLVLEPTQPWKKCGVTLDASDCSQTTLIGQDPFKVCGVMVNKFGAYNQMVTLGSFEAKERNKQKKYSQYFYAPEEPVNADGRILMVDAPSVLQTMITIDSSYGGGKISQMDEQTSTDVETAFDSAISTYAQAVYETSVLSLRKATAVMALKFGDKDGNAILPGNTCKFVSNGNALYYGYITSVVHNLSTAGGNSTVVSMTYARPDSGYKLNGNTVIAEGSPNAAYT